MNKKIISKSEKDRQIAKLKKRNANAKKARKYYESRFKVMKDLIKQGNNAFDMGILILIRLFLSSLMNMVKANGSQMKEKGYTLKIGHITKGDTQDLIRTEIDLLDKSQELDKVVNGISENYGQVELFFSKREELLQKEDSEGPMVVDLSFKDLLKSKKKKMDESELKRILGVRVDVFNSTINQFEKFLHKVNSVIAEFSGQEYKIVKLKEIVIKEMEKNVKLRAVNDRKFGKNAKSKQNVIEVKQKDLKKLQRLAQKGSMYTNVLKRLKGKDEEINRLKEEINQMRASKNSGVKPGEKKANLKRDSQKSDIGGDDMHTKKKVKKIDLCVVL